MWQSEHLKPSELIEQGSLEYRKESDVVGLFIAECCVEGPEEKVDQTDLFNEWRRWCIENGHHPGSKRGFTIRLEARGMSAKVYLGKARAYQGLRIDWGQTFSQPLAA
jgi:putative DNA primase/helicase